LKRIRRLETVSDGGLNKPEVQLQVLIGTKAFIESLSTEDGRGTLSSFMKESNLSTTIIDVPNSCPTEEDAWTKCNAIWPMQLHINSINKLKERSEVQIASLIQI
jgi:hypothetical protein